MGRPTKREVQVVTSVAMPLNMREEVIDLSERIHRSVSWIIREAVEQYLDRSALECSGFEEPVGEGRDFPEGTELRSSDF